MSENHNWQIGERVFVETMGYGSSKHIDTVKSITKSGKIKVGDSLFYPHGSQSGGDTWHKKYITPCTPELEAVFRKEITTQNTRRMLKNWNWDTVDLETMKRVIDLLPKP